MKVGDLVRLEIVEPAIQNVWIIRSLKSDARGIWIQFEETPDDTWYAGSLYKVINESR
jgi:hypothetical protein